MCSLATIRLAYPKEVGHRVARALDTHRIGMCGYTAVPEDGRTCILCLLLTIIRLHYSMYSVLSFMCELHY